MSHQKLIFFELCPRKRLITGKEAEKLKALVKSLSKESKIRDCPIGGGKLQILGEEDFFCLNCEWDDLSNTQEVKG